MNDFGYMMTIGIGERTDTVFTTKFSRIAPLKTSKHKAHHIFADKLPTLLYQLAMAGYCIVKADLRAKHEGEAK